MDIIKSKKIEMLKSQQGQTQFLKTMLNDETADDRILEWCGHLSLENAYWEMAEDFFSCLLERRKKISDFFYLAEALLNQLRYQEAEECLLETLYQIKEPCPLLFNIYKRLGSISIVTNNYSTAEEYYNKAYSMDANCLSLQFHRGLLFIKQKNYNKAEGILQSLLNNQPDNSKAWLFLAVARYKLGDRDMALACLSRCLDLDNSNKKACYLQKKWSFLTPLEQHFKFCA